MGLRVSEVYDALIDAGASKAKARAAAEQPATKQDIGNLKVEFSTAVNRMLLAQLAVAALLFTALKLF